MSARLRKFIGLLVIIGFLTLYAALVVTIGAHVPDNWAAQLAFYGPAGLLWGLPLLPLISWMNRGR